MNQKMNLPAETKLTRLVYRSRCLLSGDPCEAEDMLMSILTQSRRNNARGGITGVLLYDGQTFLQAIEGPCDAMERLYEAIACDQRHEAIELIDFTTVHERSYSQWTMGYVNATAKGHEVLRGHMAWRTESAVARFSDVLSKTVHAMLAEQAAFVEIAPVTLEAAAYSVWRTTR